MQVLCGLQVVFFLFNCQTPDREGDAGRDRGAGGVLYRAVPEKVSEAEEAGSIRRTENTE